MKEQTKYGEAMSHYVGTDIHAIGTLPATDGNFTSALNRATDEDVKKAYILMRTCPEGNKSRIAALDKEIKKRNIKFEEFELLCCDLDRMSEAEKKFTLWYLLSYFIDGVEAARKSFSECENKEELAMEVLLVDCLNGSKKIREVLAHELW